MRRPGGRRLTPLSRVIVLATIECPQRVPHDLPKVAIWIVKVTDIAAPERFVRWTGDCRASQECSGYHRINGGACRDIVAECRIGQVRSDGHHPNRKARVSGNRRTQPERQAHPFLKLEDDGPTARRTDINHLSSREAESVAVKPDRTLQIINAEGDHGDPWPHPVSPPSRAARGRPRRNAPGTARGSRRAGGAPAGSGGSESQRRQGHDVCIY